MKIRSFAGRSSVGRLPGAHARRTVATLAGVALSIALAACGSGNQAAQPLATVNPQLASVPSACSAAVLGTLSSVLQRVYREGVHGERIGSAEYLIEHSQALRTAVESSDEAGARAAAHALLKTGHMTNLAITRGGQPFIAVGGPALAPLQGTLTRAGGAPLASYRASVWADNGFLIEGEGITQGLVALRAGGSSLGGRSTGGSLVLRAAGALPDEGSLSFGGVGYSYASFPATAYPSGAVRVYLLIPAATTLALCGHTRKDTIVNTLRRVAKLIYSGELGRSADKQVHRVQHDKSLLEAVARREPAATEAAIQALLNEHIVRLRVSVGGQLLSDVGGPYVLAPVSAPLRLNGRTIGSFVLSIQDDEGYLRLTRRLAGLDVLMYMDLGPGPPQLVKDSLGPMPGPALAAVPANGAYRHEGHPFRVFTIHAKAFPSGPLTIRVLVPMPYL